MPSSYRGKLDCGDNSCQFAVKKGGMRTNGGCRCVDNLVDERDGWKLIARRLGVLVKEWLVRDDEPSRNALADLAQMEKGS